jgi:hypothetical protein
VFRAIASDARPDGIIDDIRDLRRYLLLVEAEMLAREVIGPEAEARAALSRGPQVRFNPGQAGGMDFDDEPRLRVEGDAPIAPPAGRDD